jgi:hypothetical protein
MHDLPSAHLADRQTEKRIGSARAWEQNPRQHPASSHVVSYPYEAPLGNSPSMSSANGSISGGATHFPLCDPLSLCGCSPRPSASPRVESAFQILHAFSLLFLPAASTTALHEHKHSVYHGERAFAGERARPRVLVWAPPPKRTFAGCMECADGLDGWETAPSCTRAAPVFPAERAQEIPLGRDWGACALIRAPLATSCHPREVPSQSSIQQHPGEVPQGGTKPDIQHPVSSIQYRNSQSFNQIP